MQWTWRHVAIAAPLSFIAGLLVERATHPPAPKIELKQQTMAKVDERERADVRVVRGPEHVVDRWFRPSCPSSPGAPPAPPQIIRERVVDRGPATTTTRTETARAATQETRSELSVVPPAPRPGWAVTAGLQLAPDQAAQLGLERRLIGPLWVRGWAQGKLELRPPALGVGLRLEF